MAGVPRHRVEAGDLTGVGGGGPRRERNVDAGDARDDLVPTHGGSEKPAAGTGAAGRIRDGEWERDGAGSVGHLELDRHARPRVAEGVRHPDQRNQLRRLIDDADVLGAHRRRHGRGRSRRHGYSHAQCD
jgi:hypothetical protein